jgi:hypothetical protein
LAYPKRGGEEVLGEQIVPDEIGKEVGAAAELHRGRPNPREVKSQEVQDESVQNPAGNKGIKLPIRDKVRGED